MSPWPSTSPVAALVQYRRTTVASPVQVAGLQVPVAPTKSVVISGGVAAGPLPVDTAMSRLS